MVGLTFPPQLKRLFTGSPLLSVTLLTFIVGLLYTFLSPSAVPIFPDSWRETTHAPSYPPALTPDTIPTLQNSALDLPDLHERYTAHFPTLHLPSVFDTPVYRPLAKRLHAFLARPGFDAGAFRSSSEAGCPRRLSDQLVNPDQYEGEIEFWDGVDPEEIAKRRADIVNWLADRIAKGEEVVADGKAGEGRGIVLTGGNQDTTLRLISVMKQLKRLQASLPIEVFHYPDELGDADQRREIERLGGTIREIKGVHKEEGAWKNWQIKGLAIVQSSFREVLYLDSDNTPLRDPSHLFSAPLYLTSGRAVFWPDLSKDHPHNAIWRIVGEPCALTSWTFESGQIVVDKAGNHGLNLAALLIAAGMQDERDFWFHMCGGDKDTFRWGFEVLGLPYGESPRWMGAVGIENQHEGGRFCGHSVLQYDLVVPEGFTKEPPLFVHSNLLKHLGGFGLGRGKLFTHVKRMTDDRAHLPALNYAKSFVYMGAARGMCLDLEWHDTASEMLSSEERERVRIETIRLEEEEQNVFEGFEGHFFDDGGRVGGW